MDKIDIIRKNVRKILETRKISQSAFAEMIGVQTNYISDILTGKKGQEMKIPFAEKIAKALNISFEELISSEEEVNNLKNVKSSAEFEVLINNKRLHDVLEWLQEILKEGDEEEGAMWLRREFRKNFSEFRLWLEKREANEKVNREIA